jgi:hypothetical protein
MPGRPDPERRDRIALRAITLVAAALRLFDLTHAPPGLNQDEAIGSWISWCLLKTGHDMTGQAWPIFYTHGIGDYPSTLFLYLAIPFQWLGGLNVWTARLPSAVSGVLCVPLIAYVGNRLFGRRVALVAAALLALNPWHLFLSRFGIGASHCSMFALLAIALLLAAAPRRARASRFWPGWPRGSRATAIRRCASTSRSCSCCWRSSSHERGSPSMPWEPRGSRSRSSCSRSRRCSFRWRTCMQWIRRSRIAGR